MDHIATVREYRARYALTAEFEGAKLFKFVNEATFKSTDVKEVSG